MSRVPLAYLQVSSRAFEDPARSGWRVETCQRRFVAWMNAETDPRAEFTGAEAYEWLLRVACGLESRIVGETDVFGQLKSSWASQQESMDGRQRAELSFWVQKVFEDTKEVRSQYLQGVGGSTYGTSVRKILMERAGSGSAWDPALLVGAGQLAEAILPFLGDFAPEVRVWNRSSSRLAELRRAYRGASRLEICSGDEQVLHQWMAQSGLIVFAVPMDAEVDRARVSAIPSQSCVVHLGLRQQELGPWAVLPEIVTLDTLFDSQDAQERLRSSASDRAERACRERAQLRDLAPSLSVAHGWEDLAVFA